MGRLPLHIAAERGAPPELVRRLLSDYPDGSASLDADAAINLP